MLNFDQAFELVASEATPLGRETVPLDGAAGRRLAAPITADFDFPARPTSSMDGYAVRSAEAVGAARLKVAGASYAGKPFTGQAGPGACVRIFTGASLPEGFDRVVIQEVVEREGDTATMPPSLSPTSYVRAAGSDFKAGDILLAADLELTPQRIVAAAAADRADLLAWRRPRTVVLATGDELAPPGQARQRADAIPESVSLGVAAMAANWGAEVERLTRVGDDLDALRAAASNAVRSADLVVVTGGASVGEKDFAKQMFDGVDLQLVFSKVAIKPGKPVWLGRAGRTLVLGLPGNPTSALVTGRLFLAPLVLGLCGGAPGSALDWRQEALAGALPQTDDRETFYRAARTAQGVQVLSDQNSGSQRALAAADVLIRREAGAPAASPGETVTTLDF
jgi:molybdopterin molybdotransferase